MIDLEAEVLFLYPGAYKNFDDLESNLTRDELLFMIEKGRELKFIDKKFFAALKGIDLDSSINDNPEERFETIKRRAEAKALGVDEYAYGFEGFEVIDEGE